MMYEIGEIEEAGLTEGEEEQLTECYRRYTNSQKILESLSAAYEAVENDSLGQAIHQVNEVAAYDEELKGIQDPSFHQCLSG